VHPVFAAGTIVAMLKEGVLDAPIAIRMAIATLAVRVTNVFHTHAWQMQVSLQARSPAHLAHPSPGQPMSGCPTEKLTTQDSARLNVKLNANQSHNAKVLFTLLKTTIAVMDTMVIVNSGQRQDPHPHGAGHTIALRSQNPMEALARPHPSARPTPAAEAIVATATARAPDALAAAPTATAILAAPVIT
jgi:hypothetical protein